MFCQECGTEIPDDVDFCTNCGAKVKSRNASTEAVGVKNEKSMIVALIISFILTGLGIVYAGNTKKGIILFVAGLVFGILGLAIPLLSAVRAVIWGYALYETYNEVKIANGEANPNLIEDVKGFPTPKKIGAIVVIAIIFLIVVGGVVGAFMPSHNTSTSNVHLNDDYSSSDVDLDDSSSSGSSSDSSSEGSSGSYSSSSDGYDTHSHYEDEHGSADTYGTVNDDGSVDAYQTGHTEYGDYQIDSHMDSDGNIHGTVDVGGKTYHVSN